MTELASRASARLSSDAYVRAALPVLVHRINNATQTLTGLNALLSLPGGADLVGARASDITHVARNYEEAGWLLAVFSSALGLDTLLARRERAGLEAVLHLATEMARREGCELVTRGDAPDLDPAAGDGWEAAWALGSWLHALGADRARGSTTTIEFGAEQGAFVIVDDAPWNDARARVTAELCARVPDLRWDADRHRFEIGSRWIAARSTRA